MPAAKEHLEKALHAERLALRLNGRLDRDRDWIVTLMFYAAVHLVEAHFASGGQPAHSRNHMGRRSRIGQDAELLRVALPYRDLENFSRIARYDYYNFADTEMNEAWQALRQVRMGCSGMPNAKSLFP